MQAPLPSLPESSFPLVPAPMRAMVQSAYGPPEGLRLQMVERPALGAAGVAVQVVAVSLHKGDWHLLTGTPYLLRLAGFGLMRPKRPIPGMAVAGRVIAVGPAVASLRPGDAVMGELSGGGFAEVVVATEAELARVPAGLSLEDAACLPVSATTALQGLRDAGGLQAGQSVLINGAAGGVGTFAVQLAAQLGAEVTGVCSGRNVELVRSLGAHHVIDYGREDFTGGGPRYDLILDLVGNHRHAALRGVLRPGGRLVAGAGGAEHTWVGPMFDTIGGLLSNIWNKERFVPLIAKPNPADLLAVAELCCAGSVRPVIERRYRLDELPEAMRALGQGHSRGKSVVLL
jgi:NADPH:quinone reductase-like Zn-dependent oxidoreductase